ncbi:isoleucine--tRNA ligase, partial [Candidatus Peregrinibacteria bacterium]|nr:isoleucine--tRNA ligase [Candidatus Peregrinibacteria bacterium]
MFKPVSSHQNFQEMEKEILAFWNKNESFRKSIDIREGSEEFVFYDGPPFATGLPHYGHILAGTIKDVIPRYKTMQGYKVNRQFGWDCHGLPVENLIEKELNLPNKKAIEEYGVDNFCESCRDSVLRYTSEWEETVTRMGRWVDFKDDYKTMDPEYMESIWWVFKKLWDKGLVYQGLKPMHVCPRCVTPLSNFEVNQGYKDLTDLSVTAKFKLSSDSGKCEVESAKLNNVFFLAWTTTPWTLGGNMFLAVNPDLDYVFMSSPVIPAEAGIHSQIIVLAEALLPAYEKELEGYEVIDTKKGSELVGLEYEPLFGCYDDAPSKIVAADFVTTDSGTGIVHIAPAFGEDDLQIGKKEGVEAIQHVHMNGHFETKLLEYIQKDFPEFKDIPVKSAKDNRRFDDQMVVYLESKGLVFKKENLKHSYPTCWRCETPLLNYATKSWFIAVEKIKEDLLKNNQKINWTPEHLKDGRFGNWLENACDWAVSRTRYWGTPLPVWECEETGEQMCIGSIKELEDLLNKEEVTCHSREGGNLSPPEAEASQRLTGSRIKSGMTEEVSIEDIHKHKIDHLEIKKDGKIFKRIPEVFDCWFESGSMPYAQHHHPFSSAIELKNEFYVSRHGEAKHNVKNILSCTKESASKYPLTEKGQKEVAEEAQLLQKNFDIIVASPLLRTKQTAEIFQKHCGGELLFDDRLLEHHVGELDDTGHENWRNWRNTHNPCKEAPKGGESWEDVTKRVSEILNEYNEKHSGKTILFVSHGCPSELIRNYAKGIKSRSDDGLGVPKGKPLKIENLHLPADFIAEGLDQTRGWFYTLHVLSTALFNKPAFSNVIVNGI